MAPIAEQLDQAVLGRVGDGRNNHDRNGACTASRTQAPMMNICTIARNIASLDSTSRIEPTSPPAAETTSGALTLSPSWPRSLR